MDLSRNYKESFLSEARANLSAMNAALLRAEKDPERRDLVDEIFRAAHNIKGMVAMMRREQAAALCHALEDALDAVRGGRLPLQEAAGVLFRSFDALDEAIAAVEGNVPEPNASALVQELGALRAGRSVAQTSAPEAPAPSARIDRIQVSMPRLDLLLNLAEELIGVKMRLGQLRSNPTAHALAPVADVLDRLAPEIQYQVTQARLVPLDAILERLSRMVRDLAQRQGKQVNVEFLGGDIELDRRVAEEAGDALIHLLRNAVDHGIESPERRKAASKPLQGTVRVATTRTRDSAVIDVEDDGAGLDFAAIEKAAAARGLLPPRPARSDLLAALLAGLSTKPRATDVSGRGLGLDIVRRKIESLGGTLSVKSEAQKGAAFRMEIPLTLAIVRGLFVGIEGRLYALPLSTVERIVAVDEDQVKGAFGRESIIVNGENIPLLRLRALLGAASKSSPRFPIVIIGSDDEKIGLAVDALLATQDIILKPLSRTLRGGGRFSGATVVGSGEAVLVLDTLNLIETLRSEAPR